jgi:hypothetical protein
MQKKPNKWGANIINFLKYKGGSDISLKKTELQFLETDFQTPLFLNQILETIFIN